MGCCSFLSSSCFLMIPRAATADLKRLVLVMRSQMRSAWALGEYWSRRRNSAKDCISSTLPCWPPSGLGAAPLRGACSWWQR